MESTYDMYISTRSALHLTELLCVVLSKSHTVCRSSIVVVVVSAPTTYTHLGIWNKFGLEDLLKERKFFSAKKCESLDFLESTMGNVDTKLNFRKAIVQLGTKDQVNRWSSAKATFCFIWSERKKDNNKRLSIFFSFIHSLISSYKCN